MFAQWPVPIVFSRGALVPVGVFAFLFVVASGESQPAALAVAALFGGVGGVVSLIVHELGHVSIARRLTGVRPKKVSVMALGAAAHFEGRYRNGREQVRMALGGPGASFIFALALSVPLFFPVPTSLKVGTLALVLLNLGIGGLSLLPVHPLDGHKLVVGLVWWIVGSEDRARRIIKRLGAVLLAVDLSASVFLLAARPVLGGTVIAVATVAYGQKRLFRAQRRAA